MKTIVASFFLMLLIHIAKVQETIVMTSNRMKLQVNVRGSGTPCLFIHGGPGSGSYFLEKLMGDSLERHYGFSY